MKPISHILLIFTLFIIQPLSSLCQDCDGYYPMKTGAIMELTAYNEKGKVQSISTNEIKSKDGGGGKINLKIHSETKDAKGKELLKSDYDAMCDNNTFYINMKNMISADQMKAWEGMDVKMSADDVEIPSEPIPGQALKDAHVTVDVSMSGMSMPGLKIDITNRKVESMEKLTTPAGSFECIKVSSDVRVKSVITTELHAIEWYSKGNGMVRSESYKGEKLKGYSELTKLVK